MKPEKLGSGALSLSKVLYPKVIISKVVVRFSSVALSNSPRHCKSPYWMQLGPEVHGLSKRRNLKNNIHTTMHACMLSHFSHVQLFGTLWNITHQAPLSIPNHIGMGCHDLLQGNLPNPGMKPASLKFPAMTGRFFTPGATWEANTL